MNDLFSVRQQIIEAFQSVSMPKTDKILLSSIPASDLEYQPIQEAFAGHSADSLSLEFFKAKSHWWHYLSAEAYQYYLPSLLVAALDTFDTSSSFVHGVLYGLKPDAYALYYEGSDENFIEQTSCFTPEQFCAVNAFLGLFLYEDDTDSDSLTLLAASAMRLGWGRYVCPDQVRFAEFNFRMRHYAYPPVTDPKLAALVQEIRAAFADTPYPGDNNLSGSNQGDESAECALALRGVTWQTAHPRLIASNYTALSFLTDAGHRYFLPAFLIADLLDRGDSNAEPVYDLTLGFSEPLADPVFDARIHPDAVLERLGIPITAEITEAIRRRMEESSKFDWNTYHVQRLANLTRAERVAIIHYLEYRAEQHDYHAAAIRTAIERYWKPSLEMAL